MVGSLRQTKGCHGFHISYFHAWSGVEKARSEVNGDFALSFDQLRWYSGIAEETNPGSFFDLQYDPTTGRFMRFFAAFHALY